MERIGHIARSFAEAEAWERAQDRTLTVQERSEVLAALKRRAYPEPWVDMRVTREARRFRRGDPPEER